MISSFIDTLYDIVADFIWLLVGCLSGFIAFSGTDIPNYLCSHVKNDYYSPFMMLLVMSILTGGCSAGLASICFYMEVSFRTRVLICGGANLVLVLLLKTFSSLKSGSKYKDSTKKA
mmetsp:Transcript_24819/g.30980  ORF Transcript_24819/g.30980 Transcript_24819/m.30980 type:complete len:117 (-) Transcript_24819:168-518(-)